MGIKTLKTTQKIYDDAARLIASAGPIPAMTGFEAHP